MEERNFYHLSKQQILMERIQATLGQYTSIKKKAKSRRQVSNPQFCSRPPMCALRNYPGTKVNLNTTKQGILKVTEQKGSQTKLRWLNHKVQIHLKHSKKQRES